MGSGEAEFAGLAEAAGRVVAVAGYHLLTGAGGGVMTATARAFTAVPDRSGLSLGVVRAGGVAHLGERLTSRHYEPRGPNPWVEVAIFTHLPYSGREGKHDLSRNHINVLSADVVVVLPGGDGTASELELALEYGRPVILFLGTGTVAGSDAAGLRDRHGDRVRLAASEEELTRALPEVLAAAPEPGLRRP